MAAKKQVHSLARSLFKLSFAKGVISAEQVGGVLAYIEKHKPPHAMAVLKAYHRLIAVELAKSEAVVEHAGAVSAATVAAIAATMTKKYGRSVIASSKTNDSLLAGLRVRVGDDVYEASIAGQLAGLTL